jgi:L-lysine exporter family protein LysE/ArgO
MERLFFEGFLLQASLILALGAQNVFVLESGLRRQYPMVVSFVCFLSDLTLITLGVIGSASVFAAYPEARIFIGIIGVLFLFTYGWGKIFAKPGEYLESEESNLRMTLKRSILLALTFSILNPHAYLDAFVLIGGYSAKYDLISDRLTVGLGAAVFSGVWFVLLSSTSSLMKPHLSNPFLMRKIMSASGVLLILLSGKLGMDVVNWIIQDLTWEANALSSMQYPLAPGDLFTTILF